MRGVKRERLLIAVLFCSVATQIVLDWQRSGGVFQQQQQQQHERITLVTGFWAQQQSPTTMEHPHRNEILASLVANIENPFFHQVVVILDSVSPGDEAAAGCPALVKSLDQPRNDSAPPARLSCLERTKGQPTYFEMFQYTLDPIVEGSVVVLSNADQVFDDSVVLARDIPPHVFWTLSTQGCAAQFPLRLDTTYRRIVGSKKESKSGGCPSRCVGHPNYFSAVRNHSLSWDAYVFHPALIRNSLNATHFLRPSFPGGVPTPFFMNEQRAENAALHSVSQGLLQTKNNVYFWNACKIISSWHFHWKPKMHKMTAVWPKYQSKNPVTQQPTDRVPPPAASLPMCLDKKECVSNNRPLFRNFYWRSHWGRDMVVIN